MSPRTLLLTGTVLLAALACSTEWLSEQAPFESGVTVMPAPQAAPSPHGPLTSVSVSSRYVCGLREGGSIYCRGSSEVGGDPFGWDPPGGSFSSISMGGAHGCGVRDDGSVACWGNDEHGQATPPDGAFAAVSAGHAHNCGLRDDGSVACWGNDEYGQATPPEGSFVWVSAGYGHSCGVRDGGSVACWGNDEYGQATPPEGSFASVTAVVGAHSCGVRDDGSAVCWGDDEFGLTTPPDGPFTSVSADADVACGLRQDGTIACWQIMERFGDPDSLPLDAFTQGAFTSVSVGYLQVADRYFPFVNACAVREGGSAVCWDDIPGQLPTPALSVTGRTASSLTVELGEPEWSAGRGYVHTEDRELPRYYYYQLHASQSPEGPYAMVMSGIDEGVHVVDGLGPSAVHYLALLLCDDFECSRVMAVATTESEGPVSAPDTPTGFRGKKIVNRGDGDFDFAPDDAKLTWKEVAGATYYELWKGSRPDLPFGFLVQVSAPLEAQSFEVAPNRSWGYDLTRWKVRACNKAGCSPFTDVVTIE